MRIRELIREMGGNAFQGLDIRRIKKENIDDTLNWVASKLKITDLTGPYMIQHLMGSAKKQADSGDLDIAVQKEEKYFPTLAVNVISFKPTILRDIAARTVRILGDQSYAKTDTIPGGQLNTAWPIIGAEGLVQIDFIYGNAEWLKFSHWSPGKDNSQYPGVMISTLWGVLAKMKKDYEEHDPKQIDPSSGEPLRTRRVGLKFDLEKGLHRDFEMQKRPGQGMSSVYPDEFETNTPGAPRFARIGYVDHPDDVVRMLLGPKVKRSDVDTLEKLWLIVKQHYPNNLQQIKERFIEALMRSSSSKYFSREMLETLPIFN